MTEKETKKGFYFDSHLTSGKNSQQAAAAGQGRFSE